MEPRHLAVVTSEPDCQARSRSRVWVSHHAVERYRQRVEPSSSYVGARLRLEQMAALARTRSTPRHWMRGKVSPTPGLRFLYWAQRPNICALLVDNVVVTVVTRATFTAPRTSEVRLVGRPRRWDVSPWQWDGRITDDLEAA